MFLHQNEFMYSSSCIWEENRLKAYKFYIDDGKLEQIGLVYIDGMYPKMRKWVENCCENTRRKAVANIWSIVSGCLLKEGKKNLKNLSLCYMEGRARNAKKKWMQ